MQKPSAFAYKEVNPFEFTDRYFSLPVVYGEMRMIPGARPVRYINLSSDGSFEEKDSAVASEAPVILAVNGEEWLTFSCTPNQLEELAAGFLYNESVIATLEEIASLHVCSDSSFIDVWLEHKVTRPEHWTRTSGCSGGFTGAGTTIDPVPVSRQFSPEIILENMQQLLKKQDLYHSSGGLHCSGLSDGEKICLSAEDIGRHNTLDKLAGQLLMSKMATPERLILTTGRISSEMLQKSMRLKASVVVSRTSPTSLAVTLAEQAGITLIGYARGNQFIVYTHSTRLLMPALAQPYQAGSR
jgi:FdhD protein